MAYIEREVVCKLCNNNLSDCGKEKCPVYKAPIVDIKTEVVREIFAEIENLVSVKANTVICGMRTGKLVQRVRQLAMREILAELTELKKKYTKEGVK